MKILITGARGQLGLELTKQLSEENKYELILTDRENLNIVDEDNVNEVAKINGKVGDIISNGINKMMDSFFELIKKFVS